MPKGYHGISATTNKTTLFWQITLPKQGAASEPRITPINAFQQVAELSRRDRDRGATLAHRPDEPPRFQPLEIERHADPIVPEDLDQVALAPPEAKEFSAMRITPEALLDLQRQAVHPAAHVRHPARDPDPRPRRKGDHARSRTGSSRARTAGSTRAGTTIWRPFTSVIAMVSVQEATGSGTTGAGASIASAAINIGAKLGTGASFSSPSR